MAADSRENIPVIYIVDDDDAVRSALELFLKSYGFDVRPCISADDFLNNYEQQLSPACMLLDLYMPGIGGIELQKILVSQSINIPVVIMTGHGDISLAVQTMKAGAYDFIEKPFDEQALLETLRNAIAASESKQTAKKNLNDASRLIQKLTSREHEVLTLIVQGNTNKEIAEFLSISVRTAENHRANIMHKLGAKNTSQVVRIFMSCDKQLSR